MRFKADGPAIPDILLDQRDAGNVVFLCGAGVSMPGMPSFLELAEHVANKLRAPSASEVRRALQTYAAKKTPGGGWQRPSLDRIFQMLYREYGPEEVAKIVWRKLSQPLKTRLHHGVIARLSANAEGHPQIVTTNFDRLFETVVGKGTPRYEAPVFPDLKRSPTGITYLHGRLADSESDPHNYILSSADLGRAYLAEGWAARFVRDLLQRHTVVLLGYRAEDPPVNYLLEGLESVGQRTPDSLFAFDKGDSEAVDAKWSDRGVRAIPYNGDGHGELWETLEAWAECAGDPAAWRNTVVQSSAKGPRRLAPYERGMVAHLVRTTTGAKQFANGKPAPPAEWLCVFDAAYRCAKPARGFGTFAPPFDPQETYGLDDDLEGSHAGEQHDSGDGYDLLFWRPGDESADRWQGLSRRRGPRHAPLPPRLFHLAGWLASCVTDPVLAWWVARQPALDPHLYRMLKRAVDGSPGLTDGARRGWMVLLDALEDRTPDPVDVDLYHLPNRIQKHGWTAGLIRKFETLTEPVYDAKPPMTLAARRPPSGDWSNVEWRTVADLRIRFPPRTVSWPPIPDGDVPWVYAALERNLMRTAERLREIGTEVREHDRGDRNAYIGWFRALLDRLSTLDPDKVKGHIAMWPDPDPRIFDRLRLKVWSNSRLFGPETAGLVLALSDFQFWSDKDRGELMSLLQSRWEYYSADQRRLIGQRILDGPPRTDDDDETRRQAMAASCFGWLIRNDCTLPDDLMEQWNTMKRNVPGWDDSWVDDAVSAPMALGVGDVQTNEDASVLDGVPVGDIAGVALENSGRISLSVVNEPFTGLVKIRPGRAIRALDAAARRGEFSAYLWSSALRHWPDAAPRRATRALHGHLRRLPAETIIAMPYPIGEWLEQRFPDVASEDRVFAVEVFDHLAESLLTNGSERAKSLRGEPIDPSAGKPSRPTYQRAINAPLGKAVLGLLQVLKKDSPEAGAGLPEDLRVRFERLLNASGEGADDAVCVLSSRIAWLNRVDPSWADAHMIPWFGPSHDCGESAWNGILSVSNSIWHLFGKIEDGFLDLPNRMYEWGWRTEAERYCEEMVVLASRDGRKLSFETLAAVYGESSRQAVST
ncbi:MAG: hypothetical protein F4Y24_09630 [Gemmatimonadetes bacterium]|nr:hypothetical protein [Gemmatimonadota bacterium]MYG23696.1 hypothetical protein [Gemmatimonadota bacterium]MYJ39513.1 hypothetical protein [Gemmatimonadota bacterium]